MKLRNNPFLKGQSANSTLGSHDPHFLSCDLQFLLYYYVYYTYVVYDDCFCIYSSKFSLRTWFQMFPLEMASHPFIVIVTLHSLFITWLMAPIMWPHFLSGVSHVIVDEVHERDINSDFLLILLREIVRAGVGTKVVLMSASVEAQLYVKYFMDRRAGWVGGA